jgi:hypothetical protein
MISAAIERCAGIDVRKKFLAVWVMVGPLEGEPRVEIRKFGTIRAELEGLRDWLKLAGVTHVVMESTGSYWKPVFNVLEDAVKVYLANPQEVKNRQRHKNKSSHTTGGKPWIRGTLMECAWAASAKKNCFLKDKFCGLPPSLG